MKIVKLRFKNLNSLKGEWSIDFSANEYQSEGIFAIIGSTGAGKSTILDAISLALYGKTPRLEKINNNSNEIMTKGCGDSYSELIYEVNKVKYRSHWSQNRSRKKADGKLQTPRREVAVVNGKILETKIKDVDRKTEEITGLDFDRFCRSILLAQGQFSSFLQSSPDEKSPILEQITGTEIYSLISKKSFEKSKREKEKLEELKKENNFFDPLSDEERGGIEREIKELNSSKNSLDLVKLKCEKSIVWMEGIEKLEKFILEVEEGLKRAEIKNSDSFSSRERLKLANSYLEVEPLVDKIKGGEERKLSLEKDISSLKKIEDKLSLNIEQLNSSFIKSKDSYNKLLSTENSCREKFKKVREVDLEIKNLGSSLNEKEADFYRGVERRDNLTKTIEDIGINIEKKRSEILDLEIYLKENSNHQNLEKDIVFLSGIRSTICDNRDKIDSLSKDLSNLKKLFSERLKSLKSYQSKLETKKEDFISGSKRVEDLEKRLETIVGDRSIEIFRRDEKGLIKRDEKLKDLIRKVEELIKKEGIVYKNIETIKSQNRSIQTINKQIDSLTIKLKEKESSREDIEKIILLSEKVKSLEEHRKSLVLGEPCPLCGSSTHPYSDNIPNFDNDRKRLNLINKEIKSLSEDLNNSKIDLAGFESEKRRLEIVNRDTSSEINEIVNSESEISGKDLEPLLERFSIESESVKKELENIESKIESYEEISGNIDGLKNSLNSLSRDKLSIENSINLLKQKIESSETEILKVEREVDNLTTISKNRESEAKKSILLYLNNYKDVESGISDLEKLNNIFKRDGKRLTALKLEETALTTELEAHKKSLTDLISDLETVKKSVDVLKIELTDKKEFRYNLFGENDVDYEEKKLGDSLNSLKRSFENSRDNLENEKRRFDINRERLKNSSLEYEKTVEELSSNRELLSIESLKLGFDSLETLFSSRMEKGERERIKLYIDNLDEEIKIKSSKLKELRDDLKGEKDRNLTNKSFDDLTIELDRLGSEISKISESIGSKNQIIVEDNSKREKQSSISKKIEAQTKEVVKWENLSKLIGSADGKKLRNYAQGLTFEIMVNHANRELLKMNERYTLLRDKELPLELMVMDNYQAGEIRSVKNLSGGESFLVSLSLALGLSKMASSKISVDSLFLDEGFGTLDEETLDMALSTLSSLNNQGKSIGIISHIRGLKDRINVKISVEQIGNGFSKISGPGIG